jgi:hypothetical protein
MRNCKVYINITDEQGTLIKRIDITDYDLSNPIAKIDLIEDIREAQQEVFNSI